MSPRRKHADYRPAELMLTRFASTLLVMNKAKLQMQTGAGRIVTCTMNIQCRKSAQVTVDLLQISTICFISAFTYEWVKTEREGERSLRWAIAWIFPWFLSARGGGRGTGQNAARHSDVRHVFSQWGSRDNTGDSWWRGQLVAIATAREVTHRPQSVNGKCREEIKALLWLIETAWPGAPNEPTRDVGHTETNSSVLHPFAFPGGFTYTSIGGTGAFAAKPCNLCTLSFLPAWIWIWKGTISFSVKDRHFNDIWQSFDLLGFRGRGEEIH